MLRKILIAACVLGSIASNADAGRRCGYRTYQTLYSTSGWSHSCYRCHGQKSKERDPKELLSGLAAKLNGDAAWYKEFGALTGNYNAQQTQGYGANVTYNGLYQSSPYQISGATGLGAAAYAGNPWANTSALYNQHAGLAAQLTSGASQAVDAHGKLVANEALIQAQATNFNTLAQALTAAMMGPQPVPKLESLQFQVTTNAQGQPVLQAAMPSRGGFEEAMSALSPIMTQKCISCHSGETPAGKIDMSGQLTKMQLESMAKAVDEGSMPLNPDGTPGERLSHEERDLFDEAARQAP